MGISPGQSLRLTSKMRVATNKHNPPIIVAENGSKRLLAVVNASFDRALKLEDQINRKDIRPG
jgi:hypothetical protein